MTIEKTQRDEIVEQALPNTEWSSIAHQAWKLPIERQRTPADDIAQRHTSIIETMRKDMPEGLVTRAEQFMQGFEARAKAQGLPASEVAETYKAVERLLGYADNAPLNHAQREKAAWDVIRQAADPTLSDQGEHNTCNVTTLGARAFTLAPSAVANLVADVATTGEYMTASGTRVPIDTLSMAMRKEESVFELDGARSYAEEIFDVTAVNVHWAQNSAFDNVRYFQSDRDWRDPSDTGERLVRLSSYGASELTQNGKPLREPNLTGDDLQNIYNEITGQQESGFVIVNGRYSHDGRTAGVNSDVDLHNQLSWLKSQGRLPAIIQVHTGNQPFWDDSRRTPGGWHVVSVMDYNPQTGVAAVDNQWGRRGDHLWDGISVSDLYWATEERR